MDGLQIRPVASEADSDMSALQLQLVHATRDEKAKCTASKQQAWWELFIPAKDAP